MTDKVLFIVDIQQRYHTSFKKEYLDKVRTYLAKNGHKYKHIVMIMEENIDHGDFIPKDINMELTVRPVFKCYNNEYSYQKLKNSTFFSIKDNKLIPKLKFPDGDFCFQDGNGFLIGTADEGNIAIDWMSKDLYYLLNMFRNYEIELIGGGLNHCVEKTKNYFRYMNINTVTINKDMCYCISNQSNPCDTREFDLFIENKQKD
jgi:hypothetical protein